MMSLQFSSSATKIDFFGKDINIAHDLTGSVLSSLRSLRYGIGTLT